MTWGIGQAVVVVLAVHVAGHDDRRLEAVLLAVRPASHHAHLLGHGVPRAFGLRVAVPHLRFGYGRGRVVRVAAPPYRVYHLADLFARRVLEGQARDQVVDVEKVRRKGRVGPNAAHVRGKVHQHVRLQLVEHPAHIAGRGQVVVLRRYPPDVLGAVPCAQNRHGVRAEEPRGPGEHYFRHASAPGRINITLSQALPNAGRGSTL